MDSNVWIDAWDPAAEFHIWAERELARQSSISELLINPIIWTELSLGSSSAEDLNRRLLLYGVRFVDLPRESLFSAGRSFQRYCALRKQSGQLAVRTPLPDFFIGAHAEWAGLAIITRDAARFRTYFPAITVFAPQPVA
ncbi:MAG TPA: type II toxin-antitoxin system VapC family toxin [Candidatus Limnocylindria bacterium]|nr:type II toxin-antitoxin system VapC family toxin [Candidatus Limnocylindria bacterium]